jgi:hypothetical protein
MVVPPERVTQNAARGSGWLTVAEYAPKGERSGDFRGGLRSKKLRIHSFSALGKEKHRQNLLKSQLPAVERQCNSMASASSVTAEVTATAAIC